MLLSERRGAAEMSKPVVQQIEAAVTAMRDGGGARSAGFEKQLPKARALAQTLAIASIDLCRANPLPASGVYQGVTIDRFQPCVTLTGTLSSGTSPVYFSAVSRQKSTDFTRRRNGGH
jgi:hypothetical protein